MTDGLFTDNDIEEALSRVYVQAVAARAGYSTADYSLDRDGVDILIQAGGMMRPAIALQLKATINLGKPSEGFFHYRLRAKNYNLLCEPTQTPRLLVVLNLPRDQAQWLTVTPDALVLRRSAYWLSLTGHDGTENRSSVTVLIPEQNLFNVDNLQTLMEQSREGRIE
ncbi:MAG: DUF4365 domain-containing protein [Caldilineaceae bacterium]|nr:DUF4365 domain-containing protein [Caldilineaceae bacterium]